MLLFRSTSRLCASSHFILFSFLILFIFPIFIQAKNNGVTGDECNQNDKLPCASGYYCQCSTGSCSCNSTKGVQICKSDKDCPKNEYCLSPYCISGTSKVYKKILEEKSNQSSNKASSEKSPISGKNAKPNQSKVCIAIHHLSHLNYQQMVFQKHSKAQVLCDHQGSCATPGHMILWKQKPMMMLTYCQKYAIKCIRRIMYVNSPKYRRKQIISSYTTNLDFTSFAARYASSAEEIFLKSLIHIGL